jgi:hypothetical protein
MHRLVIVLLLSFGCFPSDVHLCPLGEPSPGSACDPARDGACAEERCVCVSNGGEASGTWRCSYPVDMSVPDLTAHFADLARAID